MRVMLSFVLSVDVDSLDGGGGQLVNYGPRLCLCIELEVVKRWLTPAGQIGLV